MPKREWAKTLAVQSYYETDGGGSRNGPIAFPTYFLQSDPEHFASWRWPLLPGGGRKKPGTSRRRVARSPKGKTLGMNTPSLCLYLDKWGSFWPVRRQKIKLARHRPR